MRHRSQISQEKYDSIIGDHSTKCHLSVCNEIHLSILYTYIYMKFVLLFIQNGLQYTTTNITDASTLNQRIYLKVNILHIQHHI